MNLRLRRAFYFVVTLFFLPGVSAAQTNGPALDYSVMVGGQVNAFAADASGNMYVANSGSLLVPAGKLRKIAPDGRTVLYSKNLYPDSLAVDSAGNLWGTIHYDCASGASCAAATHAYGNGTTNSKGFEVFKLDPAGNQVFLDVFFWDAFGVSPAVIAVDAAGAGYVTGTAPCAFPTTPGGFQSLCPDATTTHAFAVKLDVSGTLVYSTFLGGHIRSSGGNGITADAAGNAYVVGSTSAADFPVTPGAYQTTVGTSTSFVTKLAANGASLVYSSYLPVSSASSVAVDAAGNAYVTGTAPMTPALPTTPGVVEPSYPTAAMPPTQYQPTVGFALKLNPSGSGLIYATYMSILAVYGYRTAGLLAPSQIAVDSTGSAYIAGGTWRGYVTEIVYHNGALFPTVNAIQNNYGDQQFSGYPLGEGFFVRLSPDASRYLMASYFGGPQGDTINGFGVTADGTIYFGGTTTDNMTPLTAALDPPDVNYQGFFGRILPSGGAVPVLFAETRGSGNAAGPAQIVFDPMLAGNTATARLGLGNYGGAPLSISGLSATGMVSQTNNCLATLPAGGHCDIDVTFSPTAVGAASGTIRVASSATTGLATATFSGSGVAAMLRLQADALSFGYQTVGTSSAPQAVTITNTSSSQISITNISTQGDFSQTSDCGVSLNAGQSCTLQIIFTPAAAGTRSGSVAITYYVYGVINTGTQRITVGGTGTPNAALPANPVLAYLPHVPYGGGFRTKITLVNFSTNDNRGVVNFITQAGQLVVSTPWNAAPGGGVRIDTALVFPNSTFGPLTVNWAMIGAESGPVSANLFYEYNPSATAPSYNVTNSVGFNDAALQTDFTVPFEQEPQPAGAQTGKTVGMAVGNPASTPVALTIKLVDLGGHVLGSDALDVPAFGQMAFALPDMTRLPSCSAALPNGNFIGTLAIHASSGVAVIALQDDYGPFSATPTMPYRVK